MTAWVRQILTHAHIIDQKMCSVTLSVGSLSTILIYLLVLKKALCSDPLLCDWQINNGFGPVCIMFITVWGWFCLSSQSVIFPLFIVVWHGSLGSISQLERCYFQKTWLSMQLRDENIFEIGAVGAQRKCGISLVQKLENRSTRMRWAAVDQ